MGTPTTEQVPDRVVIVGAGMAGVTATRELRTRGYTGSVTVIDPSEFPYDRPPLSKAFLCGETDFDKIKLTQDDWFDENGVEQRFGRIAVALRPGEGAVELDDGSTVAADAVLLALGGRARPLPCPGGDLDGVHVLRTVDDSTALRDELVPGAHVVVVGGGLIGAEVASTALKMGCVVTLIEPVLPLERAIGPELAGYLHGQHTTAGITVISDVVAEITEGAAQLVVRTKGGTVVETDVVVAGIGMIAPTELAAAAGLEVERAVVVDELLRTSNPAVLAAGDGMKIRRSDGTLTGHEHWQAAQTTGAAAAAVMLGQPLPDAEPDWFWSDRHGVHLECLGTMDGGARQVVRGTIGTNPVSVFNLSAAGHVLGCASISDTRTMAVARRMIAAGIAPDPDQLADPSTNLRKLLKG